ncbi:hypothetical protein PM082_017883 [Marasmius tenuissimus]|nr:hypothetical protein PM082_017883 [Marasmius tenuissimus]
MPLLPDTTNDLIFSCLDPGDIIHYSQTCREAYRQVQSYWTRALCIYRLLLPFFSKDEAQQFRVIQTLTGTLISGSTALQFFGRITYPDSDLDIYVEHRYCQPVASFLQKVGYKFEPRVSQHSTLESAIEYVSLDFDDFYDEDAEEERERGFAGVFNMIRGKQKIQLITARHSPIHIILNFHSTVVMNVISHSHAYSLYPKATFQKSLSMICYHCNGVKRMSPLLKYMKRGWRMIDYEGVEFVPSPTQTGEVKSTKALPGRHGRTFRKDRVRYLGDSYCWTHKLADIQTLHSALTPLALEEMQTGFCALESNSWELAWGEADFGEMEYGLVQNGRLRYTYCIAGNSTWKPENDPDAPKSWRGQRNMEFKSDDFGADSDDLQLRVLVKQRAQRLLHKNYSDWSDSDEEQGADEPDSSTSDSDTEDDDDES